MGILKTIGRMLLLVEKVLNNVAAPIVHGSSALAVSSKAMLKDVAEEAAEAETKYKHADKHASIIADATSF